MFRIKTPFIPCLFSGNQLQVVGHAACVRWTRIQPGLSEAIGFAAKKISSVRQQPVSAITFVSLSHPRPNATTLAQHRPRLVFEALPSSLFHEREVLCSSRRIPLCACWQLLGEWLYLSVKRVLSRCIVDPEGLTVGGSALWYDPCHAG